MCGRVVRAAYPVETNTTAPARQQKEKGPRRMEGFWKFFIIVDIIDNHLLSTVPLFSLCVCM